MFSIGGFSKITGLTVKTLRFYHEQGVLLPSCVDDQTGYRYYEQSKVETARIIAHLRKLEFSLSDITEILANYDDEADILDKQRRMTPLAEPRRTRHRLPFLLFASTTDFRVDSPLTGGRMLTPRAIVPIQSE